MRLISKSALLALTTALVLSAVAVSSAAATALPEFQKEGKPLAETVKFSKEGDSVDFEGEFGKEECKASITGETKGSKEVADIVIKFSKCTDGRCESPSGFETKSLHGHLGLLGEERVGLLLEGSTSVFAVNKYFPECFEGSLIFSVGNLSRPSTEASLENETSNYKGYHEQIQHFEGETLTHQIKEFGVYEVGFEAGLNIKFAKAIELKV